MSQTKVIGTLVEILKINKQPNLVKQESSVHAEMRFQICIYRVIGLVLECMYYLLHHPFIMLYRKRKVQQDNPISDFQLLIHEQ